MNNREIDELLSSANVLPAPAQRLQQIESAILGDLKPVDPLGPAGLYRAAFVFTFVAVCAIACYIVGANGWYALGPLQKSVIFLPLAVSVVWGATSLALQMRPAAKHVRSTALVSTGLFVAVVLIMAMVFQPEQESDFVRHGLACFRTGMAFGIPAAVLFALLLRRGAILSPGFTGATAGGLAGLVGLTVLEIHCPNLNVYHIVVWHVSVTVVCIILGFIFSSVTFSRWRSNP